MLMGVGMTVQGASLRPLYSLSPVPLSEWRGAWIVPFTCTPIPDRYRGNSILKWKKRFLSIEEGVSLQWKGHLFISKKRPLCLLIVVFTPLSIRRGVGGEASSLPLGEAGWGYSIRRRDGVRHRLVTHRATIADNTKVCTYSTKKELSPL